MAKYKLGDTLGSGGFGKVYECNRIPDGELYALKKLLETSSENKSRFKREVRIQAKLNHKNIVSIIEYNEANDVPWFVMPRALYSLREHQHSDNREDDLWIFNQIAEGLQHAHANGVIHRDLKPENVLFFETKDGQAIAISDFGLGRFVTRDSPSITQSNIKMGTIEYMAPEQYIDAKKCRS